MKNKTTMRKLNKRDYEYDERNRTIDAKGDRGGCKGRETVIGIYTLIVGKGPELTTGQVWWEKEEEMRERG